MEAASDPEIAALLGAQQDLFTNPTSEYYVDNPIAVTIAGSRHARLAFPFRSAELREIFGVV